MPTPAVWSERERHRRSRIVPPETVYVDQPGYCEAKNGSEISMLWPPASAIPASAQVARAPASTLLATSGASVSTGQPKLRSLRWVTTHGVNITDSIGCCDLTEVPRVINDWREEVRGTRGHARRRYPRLPNRLVSRCQPVTPLYCWCSHHHPTCLNTRQYAT